MKKIIEKPFNHKVWCDMTFDNDDLANKFVEELNSAGVSCKKNGNKVSISCCGKTWSQAQAHALQHVLIVLAKL